MDEWIPLALRQPRYRVRSLTFLLYSFRAGLCRNPHMPHLVYGYFRDGIVRRYGYLAPRIIKIRSRQWAGPRRWDAEDFVGVRLGGA